MKTLSSLTYPALVIFALACFALSPQARAACQQGCSDPSLENAFLGEDALINNTGSFNTAIGFQALFTNTAGFGNTASGVSALSANTTGFSNTATGAWALFSNTSGNTNTATGRSTLLLNTTGGSNTAMGS